MSYLFLLLASFVTLPRMVMSVRKARLVFCIEQLLILNLWRIYFLANNTEESTILHSSTTILTSESISESELNVVSDEIDKSQSVIDSIASDSVDVEEEAQSTISTTKQLIVHTIDTSQELAELLSGSPSIGQQKSFSEKTELFKLKPVSIVFR